MLIKLDQRVFHLGQAFKAKMLVEKAQRIDVLHSSRHDEMFTAIKYGILPLF